MTWKRDQPESLFYAAQAGMERNPTLPRVFTKNTRFLAFPAPPMCPGISSTPHCSSADIGYQGVASLPDLLPKAVGCGVAIPGAAQPGACPQ